MEFIKKYKFTVFLLVLFTSSFLYLKFISDFGKQSAFNIKNFSIENLTTNLQNIKNGEFSIFEKEVYLDIKGVIELTNTNRKLNGELPPLVENELLNNAAKIKLDDMFKNGYFEHNSPEGKGPGDLADIVKYEYVSVGENLAMGYFKNNEDLVTSWMNSPGHRENILSNKYDEIGVAVGKGMYKGKETWLAVQEFGRPKNKCPVVEVYLKRQINILQEEVSGLEQQIFAKKQEMEKLNPITQEEYEVYNSKVADYNNIVKIYNNRVDNLKIITQKYNNEVNLYNECLKN